QQRRFESFAKDLWRQMESFGEMLSKSATEQVINALKDVISDFNQNLTEQFGDNFKPWMNRSSAWWNGRKITGSNWPT
ncbi:hypothetical protein D6833_05875, partial [Candidatus Parcubacteria bacterium]